MNLEKLALRRGMAGASEAQLVAAGPFEDLAGLYWKRLPGPEVRAMPVDDARHGYLRWPEEDPLPPPRWGGLESWSTVEIGDEAIATVRCVVEIPGGVALGSDYGLNFWRKGRFEAFPWPAGSRREARRVEAMALHQGHLHIGTSQNVFVWDFAGPVQWTRHGRDEEDGWDDICCLHSDGERLYQGFRTRFYGGRGPADVLCMASAPPGLVYAGTREGEVWLIDQGGPLKVFADRRYDGRDKGRPIRHMAFAEGSLWMAVKGALWRFDGATWSSGTPEPTAMTVDPEGRLWALADGKLWYLHDGALVPTALPLERPWSLCATAEALWIGGRERVWRLNWSATSSPR